MLWRADLTVVDSDYVIETIAIIDGTHRDERIAGALAAWRGLCLGGARPAATRFDPTAFGHALGHLHVMDVIGGPSSDSLDFRYTVFGSAIANRMGIDMTGRLVSELSGPVREASLADYRTSVAFGQPRLSRVWQGMPRPVATWVRLTLPFGEPDVRRIVTLSLPHDEVAHDAELSAPTDGPIRAAARWLGLAR
jgi:hypothetical protein